MGSDKYGATDQNSPIELLIAALEGRLVPSLPSSWIARVHGVHRDERSWWIQIARADDETASVVLRCSRHATADHAAAVLRLWQPNRAMSLLVMNVMSAT